MSVVITCASPMNRSEPCGSARTSGEIASASPTVANHAIAVFIDTDKNQSTGGDGDEVFMLAGPLVGGYFASWNGSDFVPSSPSGFSVGGAGTNVTEFRVPRSALGNVASFNFVAVSLSIDESSAGIEFNFWDAAPDRGYFTYDVVSYQCSNGKDDDGDGKVDSADLGCSGTTDDDESDDPVTVNLSKAKTVPARPRPGRGAVVFATAIRGETGEALPAATVRCTAKVVGGASLRGAGKLASGRATCTFKIPKTLKNKVVRGTITVAYKGATASAPFSFRTAAS